MPPYPANTTFREYAHQTNLSPEEKQSMIDWINNDVPEGDISIAPKPPEYTGNSIIKIQILLLRCLFILLKQNLED